MVRHGNDDDLIAIEDVNDLVLEFANAKLSNALGNGRADFRVFGDQSHGCFDFALKAVAEALDPTIEVSNVLFKLGFRRLKEASWCH